MKLYTSSQIVRAVLFSVAGTAVLACAIFFYRENKKLYPSHTNAPRASQPIGADTM